MPSALAPTVDVAARAAPFDVAAAALNVALDDPVLRAAAAGRPGPVDGGDIRRLVEAAAQSRPGQVTQIGTVPVFVECRDEKVIVHSRDRCPWARAPLVGQRWSPWALPEVTTQPWPDPGRARGTGPVVCDVPDCEPGRLARFHINTAAVPFEQLRWYVLRVATLRALLNVSRHRAVPAVGWLQARLVDVRPLLGLPGRSVPDIADEGDPVADAVARAHAAVVDTMRVWPHVAAEFTPAVLDAIGVPESDTFAGRASQVVVLDDAATPQATAAAALYPTVGTGDTWAAVVDTRVADALRAERHHVQVVGDPVPTSVGRDELAALLRRFDLTGEHTPARTLARRVTDVLPAAVAALRP